MATGRPGRGARILRRNIMGSTFGGLEIGKRGISVHQTAINTTGHNISNADNEHYARQRVAMESMDPIYNPSLNRAGTKGQLGQGVSVAQIERIRDHFYDDQIVDAQNVKNFWDARYNYLYQMEKVFNEPTDNSLRSLTNKFWASWEELAAYSTDFSHREVVLERANSLTTRIKDVYDKLTQLRVRANNEVIADVDRVNSLATDIRDLNERIMKIQALGDQPNDLMDRRDKAVEMLSEIVNVHVGRGDKDEMIVFIGEQALVQGEIQRKLKTIPDAQNDGMARVAWEHSDRDLALNGGHLLGLLEVRDKAIVERIDQVDLYAVNMSDIVNEIHRDGFGLNGATNRDFFAIRALSSNSNGNYQLQNARANFDLNQDGTAEITAIFRVSGTNTVDPTRKVGLDGTLTFFRNDKDNTPVSVDYSRDETLEEIIKRINDSNAGVVAYMNHDNQLALKAVTADDDRRTNFMLRHLEDSGELLVGYTGVLNSSGEAGAFDFRRVNEISKLRPPLQDITLTPIFHPAAYLGLSREVAGDPASIAAGRGKDLGGTGDYNTPGGAADGTNALLVASSLKQGNSMFGRTRNPDEFYNALISKLGSESRTAEDAVMRQKDNLKELNNMRQSVMGVSLDEEMSNMVQFQHAYNASARVINTMNELLDTIINRMGA